MSFDFHDAAYAGILIPLAGMGIGALAIWTEHQRKQKALEVLKAYAEQDKETPQAVLDSMAQVTYSTPKSRKETDFQTNWKNFAFYVVMSIGFGLACAWNSRFAEHGDNWVFTLGFGITCFVMAALAASALVAALTAPRPNGQ